MRANEGAKIAGPNEGDGRNPEPVTGVELYDVGRGFPMGEAPLRSLAVGL